MTAAVCKDGCNAENSSMSSDASGDSTVARAAQTPEETPTVVVRESPPRPEEFTPGTILSDRYRIVSRLGKGGMGEVYRADDLRLGQAVALKFVVPRLAGQQQQLIDEVRVGREISHPNVCRIHDIGEIEGRLFISMEYIDGEDLASLLRRIGGLPHEKAVSIAREITAGLAAAHDRGIVHRDLKPANIMIDGRGNARITDFGLARSAAGNGPGTVSGTPAYMAPEQFTDAAPTTASDVYALGLIFFELWTGRRLFAETSISDIIDSHRPEAVRSTLRSAPALDPKVAALIDTCLDDDPSRRPASARAVLAALPGRDALDSAVAAGQTPSPEMLAAAAGKGELSRAVAWSCFLATVAILVAVAALSTRTMLHGRVALRWPASHLETRAKEMLEASGWSDAVLRPRDSDAWFIRNDRFLRWREKKSERAATSLERGVLLVYRQSPEPLLPLDSVTVLEEDPPLTTPGMARLLLDSQGRLYSLAVVPPIRLRGAQPAAPGASPGTATAHSPQPPWPRLLELAGLSPGAFTAVAPAFSAPVDNDAKAAWQGRDPLDGAPIRVEAAALEGRPVWFEVMGDWNRGGTGAVPLRIGDATANAITTVLFIGISVATFFLVRRNLRRGQGDRRGAWRLATFVVVTICIAAILRAHHSSDPMTEVAVGNKIFMIATYIAIFLWIAYVAVEPLVRRRWPRTLISWSRVLEGRLLDPMVARDILIGLFAGAATVLLQQGARSMTPVFGMGVPAPWHPSLSCLTAPRHILFYLVFDLVEGVARAASVLVLLVLIRGIVRNQTAALALVFLLITVTTLPMISGSMPLRIITAAIGALAPTLLIVRFGLLSVCAYAWLALTLIRVPLTLDSSSWHFAPSLGALAVLIAVAAFAFHRSLGGKPLFAAPVFEE